MKKTINRIVSSILLRQLATFGIFLMLTQPTFSATFEVFDESGTSNEMEFEHFNSDDPFPDYLGSLETDSTELEHHYETVVKMIKQKHVKEAREKIEALFKQYPNQSLFYGLSATLDVMENNKPAARKNLLRAIEMNPNDQRALVSLAMLELGENQLDQAHYYAKRALVINDKFQTPYFVLADIANKQHDKVALEQWLKSAYQKARGAINSEIKAAAALGQFYLARKQAPAFLALAEEFVQREPNNSRVLFLLSQAQIANRQFLDAEHTLKKLIEEEKQDIQSRFLLVRLLMGQPDQEKAIVTLLDEIAVIAPDNLRVRLQQVAFLIKLERYQDAEALVGTIERLSPKKGLSQTLQGKIYSAEGDFDQSLASYRKAYSLNPNDELLLKMVDILNEQGKTGDAIALLEKALNKDASNLTFHFKLANIYERQQRFELAKKHYRLMLNKKPDNVLAMNNLAWLYLQQNNPGALELAEKAYRKAPETAAIVDTYGTILARQGKPEEGIELLEQAVKLAPKAGDIHYHLAEAYAENGDSQRARSILQAALQGNLDFSEKAAAEALLRRLQP
ncbi:tetratricopeptide repeat protein [Methylomarinum vadi]|uniref:tetratricopeptide repeat protein n=1 Tax=Methylomarinum vadi TaxID=438855 RepID=UPI0004DF85E7|nr:tetratricopeptide repeat protein [Methylomarinum vadi]